MKKKKIQLSREFKTQATKAIIAICLFIFAYILILILAFGLAAVCIAGGVFLIVLKPMFITILLGIGLASMGILVLIFLLKFIFKSHKTDLSHLVEIKETEEPQLYMMIREIVFEVGTRFPKKVYLAPNVNAAVFYNSNFWSMFLPVKKNLQIGLGLVNTVTKEELRAILAHEFGHFSQRTMKIGSYVYNVNQVIHNMLYDNESYEKLIEKWADFSYYFSLFVIIAVKINVGIQWILRKLYEIVNKSYMGLSREMEFHADEIAASVTGYKPLTKSLLRLAIADNSFGYVLDFYNGKISDNLKSENLYHDQSSVIHFLSEENNLKMTNNLPELTLEEQSKFDKSKLIIKDQWASHPSIKERIERLEKTGYKKDHHSEDLANTLFTDIIGLQKQITNKLFEAVEYPGEVDIISAEKFIATYKQLAATNSFSKIYNGYYDNKNPEHIDLDQIKFGESKVNYMDLYSDEKVDLVYSSIGLQNDIDTLKNISNRSIEIKTFDYDGTRYQRKHADDLVEKLKIELMNFNEKIKSNDVDIYQFFLDLEGNQNKSKDLKRLYAEYFEYDRAFDTKYNLYLKILKDLEFMNVSTPFEQIRSNFEIIKPYEETIKQHIKQLLSDSAITNEITGEIKHNLEKYISQGWEYFGVSVYHDENLNLLYSALHNYAYVLSRKYFLLKKALLEYQEELIINDSQTVIERKGEELQN